ncbi:MAG: creatininase family protein, partial [Pseudomonadota bacterium]
RVDDGVATLVLSWDDLETDEVAEFSEQERGGHADEIETSIMLFLAPELVDMDAARTDYGDAPPKDYGGYRPGLFARDKRDPNYSATGSYGDATLATAEKGERTLAIMRREWLRALSRFAETPVPPAKGASKR